MGNRTQIVCLCEGSKGQSIDEVFINKLVKRLDPPWLRPWKGSNTLRLVPCGGRAAVIQRMPAELRHCLAAGGDTTLMVWADIDKDHDGASLVDDSFWPAAQQAGISREDFNRVVLIFAKYRLENWIEFLQTGSTDESLAGPRVKHNRAVAEAAKKLADSCKAGKLDAMPRSLQWSCKNWHALVDRMRR